MRVFYETMSSKSRYKRVYLTLENRENYLAMGQKWEKSLRAGLRAEVGQFPRSTHRRREMNARKRLKGLHPPLMHSTTIEI